jgi:hypothetical protein
MAYCQKLSIPVATSGQWQNGAFVKFPIVTGEFNKII